MSVLLLWLQLAAAAVVILGAANYMAKSADVIALKTGLGRSFIGVVLLATATSMPELGTGISSIALVGEPDLAAGDAFGSNLFNLLIIGLLDLYWREGPILKRVSPTSVVVAALGVVMISLAAGGLLLHEATTAMDSWYISPVSIIILGAFVTAMYVTYRFDRRADYGAQEQDSTYADDSLSRHSLIYALSAAVVIGAAIWLAQIGDGIADTMGWETSFVGTQFLALSTSLPELAASFAAIRINAPELAITNVLGSNIFNMGFVLFIDELALTEGPLFAKVSTVHAFTAVAAVLMTAIVIIALASHMRTRPSRFWTAEAVLLIGLYLVASFLVFALGGTT